MAEENNKRVLVGGAVFAVLILLNLIVRSARSPSVQQPTAAPVAQTQQIPTSPITSVTERVFEDTVLSDGFIVESAPMEQVHNAVQNLWQLINDIPEPLAPPRLDVEMQLTSIDRFRWPTQIATEIQLPPAEPEEVLPATVTLDVQVLGVFDIRGKKVLMVKEGEKVVLVDEKENEIDERVSFKKISDNNFVIRDSTGATHDVKAKRPESESLSRALEILSGKSRQQPVFMPVNLAPDNN